MSLLLSCPLLPSGTWDHGTCMTAAALTSNGVQVDCDAETKRFSPSSTQLLRPCKPSPGCNSACPVPTPYYQSRYSFQNKYIPEVLPLVFWFPSPHADLTKWELLCPDELSMYSETSQHFLRGISLLCLDIIHMNPIFPLSPILFLLSRSKSWPFYYYSEEDIDI